MSKLDWSTILQYYPELKGLGDGEQVNRNHPACPAGSDTKKRLFVRKVDGTLLGYCHHCGDKGAQFGKKNYIKARATVQVAYDLRLPWDYGKCDMHVAGKAWLNKFGINEYEATLYGIKWSEDRHRLVLPIHDLSGKLVAYQTRRLLPYDTMPKYLTDKQRGVRFPLFLGTKQATSTTIVLTEDILSAIKVGRQCEAAALIGTNLSTENRNQLIAAGYTKFIVWLDDDNYDVRKRQREIVHSIAPFADVTKITGHTCDPKAMTDATIKDYLKSATALL